MEIFIMAETNTKPDTNTSSWEQEVIEANETLAKEEGRVYVHGESYNHYPYGAAWRCPACKRSDCDGLNNC